MAVVHRTYARALLDAAKEQGRVAEVREELVDFAASAREVPELGALLANPELDRQVKRAALRQLLARADELVRNFLLLLVEKGRAGDLDDFVREFERLVAAEERRLEVELTTAVELSDEEARSVIAQIERAAGRRVEARRRVDPALIGGLVLQVGSFRVDASVRGRLERLRRELRSGARASV
ncbi:MAG: ATP synthase F1 subunit delta [Thermoleophilia bacterium]|nr:ATP synthase F1 subunit delta [Thermoleophilia bacterium]